MKHILTALTLVLATPTLADECPMTPDHTDALSALIEGVQAAETEFDARVISQDMWALWTAAPDVHAQNLLDEGMARREISDYDGALAAFEGLVAYCPDYAEGYNQHYAEGYNQRAFVRFLKQDYDGALPDLERAAEMSPRHLGVLTGMAMTLIALDRNAEAALVLRRALALNPWLGERHLLPSLEAKEDAL